MSLGQVRLVKDGTGQYMEISQLNGAQQKKLLGPSGDKILEGGFCSKIRVLEVCFFASTP